MQRKPKIKFQELYLELSYLCNAECDHCYVSSSPRADRSRLDLDLACRAVEESLPLTEISSQVAIAGGEPTLFWDDLLRIIGYAARRNLRVLLVSNGWWGRSLKVCEEKLDALIENGLTRLEISTSSYHRQFIDTQAINNITRLSRDLPLEIALHIRFSQSCGDKENLALFKNLEHVELLARAITPIGRAGAKISDDELRFTDGFPRGSCQNALSFLINPKGDCFPCCGGSELSDYLCLGNFREEPLKDIVARAQERELLSCITRKGTGRIAEALPCKRLYRSCPGHLYRYLQSMCSNLSLTEFSRCR